MTSFLLHEEVLEYFLSYLVYYFKSKRNSKISKINKNDNIFKIGTENDHFMKFYNNL